MRKIKFRALPPKYQTSPRNWIYYDGIFNGIFEESTLIDDDTLSQFTGLKDKNGKEIYEGDIVEHYKEKYEVKYGKVFLQTEPCSGYSGIMGFGLWKNGDFDDSGYLHEPEKYLEVIGNIYESPELLN